MTPEQIRDLGLVPDHLAGAIGVHPRTVRRWLAARDRPQTKNRGLMPWTRAEIEFRSPRGIDLDRKRRRHRRRRPRKPSVMTPDRIRALMAQNDWSGAELGRRCGLTKWAASTWIRGRAR